MYLAPGIIIPPEDFFTTKPCHKLLDSFKHPNDNYLWYVLVVFEGDFISWRYNGQTRGLYDDHYIGKQEDVMRRVHRARCNWVPKWE
jgi:hypothetical protein